ncbi:hypothetical protein Tco_0569374 [Tanacetum coccineum]
MESLGKAKLQNSLYRRHCVVMISHDVTPRVSVLAECDRLVSEPLVIENFDVCHEKVVEIPLEGSRKLRVQGERTLGAAKALMNAKVNEPKVGDISVVRDFVDVFPEDFSRLLPQRQVACSMSRDWESSLTGLELVLETTDKVYCFEKKGKLAQRYVGPFEILERIGPVAYRLRLPEELSGVHDTFHVSNLKRCLAYASCCFGRWNYKRGPEFTWERECYMKSKYPQLFVDRADESAS